jgi:hypothetical protein
MTTTTTTATIQQNPRVLCKEYREVNAAMLYVARNMSGLTKAAVLRILQGRLDELGNEIHTHVPHLITRDQVSDWIRENAE